MIGRHGSTCTSTEAPTIKSNRSCTKKIGDEKETNARSTGQHAISSASGDLAHAHARAAGAHRGRSTLAALPLTAAPRGSRARSGTVVSGAYSLPPRVAGWTVGALTLSQPMGHGRIWIGLDGLLVSVFCLGRRRPGTNQHRSSSLESIYLSARISTSPVPCHAI